MLHVWNICPQQWPEYWYIHIPCIEHLGISLMIFQLCRPGRPCFTHLEDNCAAGVMMQFVRGNQVTQADEHRVEQHPMGKHIENMSE